MAQLGSEQDERIGGASAVDPQISRSLLRPSHRPHGGRCCRAAALAAFLIVLTVCAPARAAEPRPDPPPTWAGQTTPRPELPPGARHEGTGRRYRPAPAVTVRSVPVSPASAPQRSRVVLVRKHTARRGEATKKAQAQPRPRPVATPTVPPLRQKGPYVFPEAGAWSAVASRGEREPFVLVGLAALLLAFGSGSLAVTVKQLRARGT
jgi:hypothetical protein